MDDATPRRGGPNGVWCLGNNEPDGKNWLANWNGESVGCVSEEEAHETLRRMRDRRFLCPICKGSQPHD